MASSPPYGYVKDPNDHNHWLIDEEAAEVVRRIYRLTIEGYGPYQISQILTKDGIEIPAVHQGRKHAGLWQSRLDEIKDPCAWGASTVVHILSKREYLGETVNFKTRKHFKDKKSHYVPANMWMVFPGTQEPILDEETFFAVQRIRANVKRYPNGFGPIHPLTGVMICADCGRRLYEQRISNGRRVSQFRCPGYTKPPVGGKCPSPHQISGPHVVKLLSDILHECSKQVKVDREAFIRSIGDEQAVQQSEEVSRINERLRAAKTRAAEIEKLLCRIYEDHALDKIPDSRYEAMNEQYTQEMEGLQKDIAECNLALENEHHKIWSASRFADLISQYETFEEITPEIVNTFVEKIVVHEREVKGSQTCPQQVDIHFNFVGAFIPDGFIKPLSPEEQKAAEEHAALLARFRSNYRKRVENGTQKIYERKSRARIKAEMEARKAERLAEDIANGIVIVNQPILEPQKGVVSYE